MAVLYRSFGYKNTLIEGSDASWGYVFIHPPFEYLLLSNDIEWLLSDIIMSVVELNTL